MGTYVEFAVERRQTDGSWRRVEALVPNTSAEWIVETHPTALTQYAPMVHETWTFGPYVRQKWVLKVDWPNLQPIPNDASQETLDFPTVFANDISDPDDVGMLTLRTLLETDWKACQHSYADQEELQTAREEIIQKLSPLGGLDDVRLFFGVNY